jgi:hypothetical protein
VTKPKNTNSIKQQMERLLADTSKLTGFEKWNELKRIRALPYAKMLGKLWLKQVDESIEKIEAVPSVQKEAKALVQHRKLLFREITERSLEKMKEINFGYIKFLAEFNGTSQAKLADADRQRIVSQIKFLKENQVAVPEVEKKQPTKPNFPKNKRRIPGNPLVK